MSGVSLPQKAGTASERISYIYSKQFSHRPKGQPVKNVTLFLSYENQIDFINISSVLKRKEFYTYSVTFFQLYLGLFQFNKGL